MTGDIHAHIWFASAMIQVSWPYLIWVQNPGMIWPIISHLFPGKTWNERLVNGHLFPEEHLGMTGGYSCFSHFRSEHLGKTGSLMASVVLGL